MVGFSPTPLPEVRSTREVTQGVQVDAMSNVVPAVRRDGEGVAAPYPDATAPTAAPPSREDERWRP
jgi:hypothetical protein